MKKTIVFAIVLCALASASLPSFAQKTTSTQIQYTIEKHKFKPRYQGDVNVGYALTFSGKYNCFTSFGTNSSWFDGSSTTDKDIRHNVFLTTVHGVRIRKWFFVGAGVGVRYMMDVYRSPTIYSVEKSGKFTYDDTTVDYWLIPIFANVKFYLPCSEKLFLYFSGSFGGGPGINASSDQKDYITARGGYYGDYSIGLNYGKLDLSLGVMQQNFKTYLYDVSYSYYNYKNNLTTGTVSCHYRYNSFAAYLKVGIKF